MSSPLCREVAAPAKKLKIQRKTVIYIIYCSVNTYDQHYNRHKNNTLKEHRIEKMNFLQKTDLPDRCGMLTGKGR